MIFIDTPSYQVRVFASWLINISAGAFLGVFLSNTILGMILNLAAAYVTLAQGLSLEKRLEEHDIRSHL